MVTAVTAPAPGSVWINDDGMSFTVEAVTQEPGAFVAEVTDPASQAKSELARDEFTADEWRDFIEQYRLRPAS